MATDDKKQLSPKEAVLIAQKHFIDLFEQNKYTDIRLEELDVDMKYWNITFGYYSDKSSITDILSLQQTRQYKKVVINKITGELVQISMVKSE